LLSQTPLNTVQDRDRKAAVAAHFDRAADLWSQLYEDVSRTIDVRYRVFMRQRLGLVLDALDSFAGQRRLRVLDIGCGAGRLVRALALRSHSVVGADVSPAMLERARSAVADAGASLLQADAELLPLRKSSFDVVCCLGLLEYLKGDQEILQEIDDLLRPGGMLIVTLPNLLKLPYLLDPYYYAVRGVGYIRHRVGLGRWNGRRAPTPDDVNGNQGFVVRRFLRGHLDGPLSARGYRRVRCAPVGFGPFTFWQRTVGSEQSCLRWSGRLDRLCRTTGFRWMAFFGNRWVFAYVKERE
jgi:SAM-dependent methyltransferase